jgi:hypothetical protein
VSTDWMSNQADLMNGVEDRRAQLEARLKKEKELLDARIRQRKFMELLTTRYASDEIIGE